MINTTVETASGLQHPRYDLLGVQVSAISLPQAVELIARAIQEGVPREGARWVCVTGVHGVMESQRDPELQRIHNRAFMVTPDGMPLVWLGRKAGYRHMTRVYGPDLMTEICRLSPERGWRHFLYGGEPGVEDLLAQKLRERFPGIEIVGTWCPPFRPLTDAEKDDISSMINRARPDIVWVGLSTPKQERWMAEMAPRLRVPVLVGVGAAFDFLSGRKPQAPRWMQRSGLEWLFRLMTEPRRLWRRYLVNNMLFVLSLLCGNRCLQELRRETNQLSRGGL